MIICGNYKCKNNHQISAKILGQNIHVYVLFLSINEQNTETPFSYTKKLENYTLLAMNTNCTYIRAQMNHNHRAKLYRTLAHTNSV